MNILVANNRFFVSGGPERYLFTLIDLLEKNGHSAIPFSNAYRQNNPSPYAAHFLPPPVDADAVYYRQFRLAPWKKLQLFSRSVYYPEAYRRVAAIIVDRHIDLAYLLAIANYISPSIISACKARRIPVVMRLSDFNLLCPAYLFLREERPCEECLHHGLQRAIVHRCLQSSVQVSLARVVAMTLHRLMRVYDQVDAFITPSRFLMAKMVQGGFPAERLHYVPSPVKALPASPEGPGEYILYFGRITPEKGLETLLLGFEHLSRQHPAARLLIAGAPTPELERLEHILEERQVSNVEFVGFQEGEQLAMLIDGARFSVCPSIWYENSPMTVYESLAHARPVIVSNLGSLPEQVEDGTDGLLFEPGNHEQLADKMAVLWQDPSLASRMGKAGRDRIQRLFSPEAHYRSLLAVFDQILN